MPDLEQLLAEVDKWFAEEVQRPPVSHYTEIYNQMHAARGSLRNRLSVLVTGKPLDPPAVEPEAGSAEGEPRAEDENASGDTEIAGETSSGAKGSKSSKAGS